MFVGNCHHATMSSSKHTTNCPCLFYKLSHFILYMDVSKVKSSSPNEAYFNGETGDPV